MAERTITPRAMMERAIEVMLQSIPEPRSDGKASPKVGAILLLPDGRVLEAYRGELRHGDHAEYTLLERKCRDQRLDGSVLFATLEPCTPGSRRHPKLGCAERIALARIKEVYVGIEDPDPTVDRKGIKYLQDNGITVHMFDRDLQETIREANKDFIAQALERAAAAEEEKKPKVITLSPLEDAFAYTETDDFSPEALERYRHVAGIQEAVNRQESAIPTLLPTNYHLRQEQPALHFGPFRRYNIFTRPRCPGDPHTCLFSATSCPTACNSSASPVPRLAPSRLASS